VTIKKIESDRMVHQTHCEVMFWGDFIKDRDWARFSGAAADTNDGDRIGICL